MCQYPIVSYSLLALSLETKTLLLEIYYFYHATPARYVEVHGGENSI